MEVNSKSKEHKKRIALLCFLCKRLLTKPVLLFVLGFTPIIMVSIELYFLQDTKGYQVGICSESESQWNKELIALFIDNNEQYEGIIEFVFYDNQLEMIHDIQSNYVDCGYILQENLQKRVEEQQWNRQIITYSAPKFLAKSVVDEIFIRYFFEYCSNQWYVRYLAENEVFSEINEDELKNKMQALLNQQSIGDETFQLEILELGGSDQESKITDATMTIFPLRGMCVIYIFFISLMSVLDSLKDRDNMMFIHLKKERMVTVFNIVTPVIISAISSLICFYLVGQWKGIVEFYQMFVYVVVVCLWSIVFSYIIKKESYFFMVLPVVLTVSILITPMFWDLGNIFSVIAFLEKGFPMYYYYFIN